MHLFIRNYTIESQIIAVNLDIDDSTLFEIISTFEQHATVVTDLVAGFLLEGRISNISRAQQSINEHNLMQRRLIAMDFFRRAACLAKEDREFSRQIEDMVFHIKCLSEEGPIAEKLSHYQFARVKYANTGSEHREKFIVDPMRLEPFDFEKLRLLLIAPPRPTLGFFAPETAFPDDKKPMKRVKYSALSTS